MTTTSLTAKVVKRAENYRWESLWNWCGGDSPIELAPWPVKRLPRWIERVNEALTKKERDALQNSVIRGCPFGDDDWVRSTAEEQRLELTLRPRGRPKKVEIVFGVRMGLAGASGLYWPLRCQMTFLSAGLDTIRWTLICCRNLTLHENASVKQVNDLMEAIHEVPGMLMNWQPHSLDELELQELNSAARTS